MLQAPQWFTSERMSTSQPLVTFMSQLAKPGLHEAMPQVPPVHDGVPLAGVRHALPQAPQWASVVLRLVSQPLAAMPSQLPRPAAHIETMQAPPTHTLVPPGSAQRIPHPLQ
jgi:hypothetical protein